MSQDNFVEAEKNRQIFFKKTSPFFSEGAREDGPYGRYIVPYCLPKEFAEENLFSEIREEAIKYFANNKIEWHRRGWNHLLSSQTFCVNFLFPFSENLSALQELFRPFLPMLQTVDQIEKDRFISFEWNGIKNYLNEVGHGSRGSMSTCPDAAILFKDNNFDSHILLIEWKFTETYKGNSKALGKSGERRKDTYRPFYESDDCPIIDKSLLPDDTDAALKELFYEPFYQLLREQLLAHEMEKDKDLSIKSAILCHISPSRHVELSRNIPSVTLRKYGNSITKVWKSLMREPSKFLSISTEDLFRSFPINKFPELKSWRQYMGSRYSWLLNHETA